jgi:hypothetical protein
MYLPRGKKDRFKNLAFEVRTLAVAKALQVHIETQRVPPQDCARKSVAVVSRK